jgi:hypothetical protein
MVNYITLNNKLNSSFYTSEKKVFSKINYLDLFFENEEKINLDLKELIKKTAISEEKIDEILY